MKKFIKSPLGISLATTLFSFLLSVLYDLIKGKHILSTIVSVLKAIWSGLIRFLNFDIKLWWLIVGFVVMVLLLPIIYRVYQYWNEDVSFTKYTKDNIRGWKWEWHWYKNQHGVYDIENLHPICNKCDSPLMNNNDYQNNLYCVRCGQLYNRMNFPDLSHIKTYILDNVKREMYPKDNS